MKCACLASYDLASSASVITPQIRFQHFDPPSENLHTLDLTPSNMSSIRRVSFSRVLEIVQDRMM